MFSKILIVFIIALLTAALGTASPISDAVNGNANELQNKLSILNRLLPANGYPGSYAFTEPQFESLVQIHLVVPNGYSRNSIFEDLYSINKVISANTALNGDISITVDIFNSANTKLAFSSLSPYGGTYISDSELAQRLVDGTIFYDEVDLTSSTSSTPSYQYTPVVQSKPQMPDINTYFQEHLLIPVKFKVNVDSTHIGISYDANSGYNYNSNVIYVYQGLVSKYGYKGYLRVAGFSNSGGVVRTVYDETIYP